MAARAETEAVEAEASRSGAVKVATAVACTAIGLALAWQVVTKSYVAYLAATAPEQALRWDVGEPRAIVERAETAINVEAVSSRAGAAEPGANATSGTAPPETRLTFRAGSGLPAPASGDGASHQQASLLSPEKNAQYKDGLELAVRRDPVNARAFRLLGQLAQDTGNMPEAGSLMEAAARRSQQEGIALYWLLRRSVLGKDHARAIHYADILMRTRSDFAAPALQLLARLTDSPQGLAALEKTLAANPPWRRNFFNTLPTSVTDARVPLALLLALKNSPAPPKLEETRAYIEILLANNLYDLAFYTWLEHLSPEQLANAGFLFNGSFETDPTNLPFDWSWREGREVNVEIAPRTDQPGHRALLIEFEQGRAEFGGVRQVIMLGPGSYKFVGLSKGTLTGRRGLSWRLTCVGGQSKQIGESAMLVGAAPTWREFSFGFKIPESECPAQTVVLMHDTRSASEQLITGEIWFDELRIVRDEPSAR